MRRKPCLIIVAKNTEFRDNRQENRKMIQIMTTLPDVQIEPHPHGICGYQNLAGVRRIIELRIQEQRIIGLRIQEQRIIELRIQEQINVST
jgi:hypothetical protein